MARVMRIGRRMKWEVRERRGEGLTSTPVLSAVFRSQAPWG